MGRPWEKAGESWRKHGRRNVGERKERRVLRREGERERREREERRQSSGTKSGSGQGKESGERSIIQTVPVEVDSRLTVSSGFGGGGPESAVKWGLQPLEMALRNLAETWAHDPFRSEGAK